MTWFECYDVLSSVSGMCAAPLVLGGVLMMSWEVFVSVVTTCGSSGLTGSGLRPGGWSVPTGVFWSVLCGLLWWCGGFVNRFFADGCIGHLVVPLESLNDCYDLLICDVVVCCVVCWSRSGVGIVGSF